MGLIWCPDSELNIPNFTFLLFYQGVCSEVQNLGSWVLIGKPLFFFLVRFQWISADQNGDFTCFWVKSLKAVVEHHGVSSFYTQITREYHQFDRLSFTEYRTKEKYERVSHETALLAIWAHILALNTTNFCTTGFKKIWAILRTPKLRRYTLVIFKWTSTWGSPEVGDLFFFLAFFFWDRFFQKTKKMPRKKFG